MKKIKWSYAFGEILIVILGISIAFSMNKCAEESRDNKLKKQYIESLISDLDADKKQLTELVGSMQEKLETIQPLLTQLDTNAPEKQKLIRNVMSAAIIHQFIPRKATFNTLVNSGDLKLIEDIELKKDIDNHYTKSYTQFQNANFRVENINKEYLADYFIYNDFATLKIESGKQFTFKDENLLKGIFNSTFYAVKYKILRAQESIKSCKNLIEKLKEELE
ncbi:DUF6090 family protein [Spongiivirga citrea]|uniref:Uncharacterized protein n=1 Tax=Spongiivirga citrea TaxID=1481457 RepID=A0A6M0CPD2_9FLAO|nr:DUF6090 family protein [Spongiivirga citrea]NER18793.1 hypothetical protein [Spongiivirga citrea]